MGITKIKTQHINVPEFITQSTNDELLIRMDVNFREGADTGETLLLQEGFAIVLCKGNGGQVVINGKEYRLMGNNVIILSNNQIVNHMEPALISEGKMIVVTMEYVLGLPSPIDTNFFSYSRYLSVISLTDEKFADLDTYFHFIHKEANETGKYQKEIIRFIFHALILELLAEYEHLLNLNPEVDIRDESLSDRFFRLLAVHFREEHTVRYYADRLSVTPKYLSTAIKRITGRPVLDWIHEAILIESQMLLRTTDLTVQEIADRLYFSSPSAFVQFFKKHTGTTPKRLVP